MNTAVYTLLLVTYHVSIGNRRFAVFRRRAVDKTFRLLAYNHICSHSSVWETAARSADDRLNYTIF